MTLENDGRRPAGRSAGTSGVPHQAGRRSGWTRRAGSDQSIESPRGAICVLPWTDTQALRSTSPEHEPATSWGPAIGLWSWQAS